jgi:hypothetical protein
MEVKVNESNLHWRAARSCNSLTTMAFQLERPSMEAILKSWLGLVEACEVWKRGRGLRARGLFIYYAPHATARERVPTEGDVEITVKASWNTLESSESKANVTFLTNYGAGADNGAKVKAAP